MSCDEWFDDLLRQFLVLTQQTVEDNFDAMRFDSKLAHTFLLEYHLHHLKFVFACKTHLFGARSRLENSSSQLLFDQLLLYRMLGQMHVKLPTNTPMFWHKRKLEDALFSGNANETGSLGNLKYFDLEFLGYTIRLKAWPINISASFSEQQYFYRENGVVIAPSEGDYVIDAGSCFGDTALAFAAAVGDTGRVYTFDMVPHHLNILQQNLEMNPKLASRIEIVGYGLSDISNALPEAMPSESASNGTIQPDARLDDGNFPVRTIDDLMSIGRPSRVDFLKMDIEGSELAALHGAEQTIRKFKPNLAISIYHKPEDFYLIQEYLDQLGLGYQFYLGHYTIHAGETILYATQQK